MKQLNLSPHFSPFGSSITFESFVFSGGEPHIKIRETLFESDEIMITHRVQSFNDMGLIILAVDALRRMSVKRINMLLPYFPGARQDRLMTTGEPLTVRVYADLINSLNFETVTILDPHSEVTPALVNNVRVVTNHQFVGEATAATNDYLLIAPDAGAIKKIQKLAAFLENENIIECGKVRNVLTGELTGFTVNCDDLESKTCVVVDDICDGGGTFLGLADELKKKNAGRLILIVTHGIFSKGSEFLTNKYDEVICSDAFSTLTDTNINQIALNANLLK